MASVTLTNLVKRFGEVEAVRGISLEIADGEFMAILGPSGCGKSSTMRMVAGLEQVTEGEIAIDGKPVHQLPARDRNVAMAFESYALYPTMNVRENLAFPLRAAKTPEAEITRRVEQVADTLEITEVLERSPGELGGGQAQRVGLGRALIRDPDVFLLDEPISHLDTRQRSRMRAYLKRLHQTLGHTMIYVTHDQQEAMAMADRIAIMESGRISQVGGPEQIFSRPVDRFVAGFVGEPPMNFLPVSLERRGGRALVSGPGGVQVELAANGDARSREAGREFTLGIRPVHLEIADDAVDSAVEAEIFVVEPLGDMTVVTAELADQRVQVVTAPSFRASAGDSIRLRFPPHRVLLFGADGAAITSDGEGPSQTHSTKEKPDHERASSRSADAGEQGLGTQA